jgi:acyl phosphate:glycerol-3-phosphate acyltransferase
VQRNLGRMANPRVVLAAAAGYMLGTTPSADLASRFATRGDVDLRQSGSGNPGAINAANVLGRRWGAAVLAADAAKGFAAGMLGRAIGGDRGAYVAVTAVVAGHIAPAWNGFRGGKGVATCAGACLAVFPGYFPAAVAVTAAGAALSHDAERAMQMSLVSALGAGGIWWLGRLPNAWGPRPSAGLPLAVTAITAMVLAKFAASSATSSSQSPRQPG